MRTRHASSTQTQNCFTVCLVLKVVLIICIYILMRASSDQGRYKVLEMDTNGNLYLYKSALLCKNEVIKRLTEGNYQLTEPSCLGNTI